MNRRKEHDRRTTKKMDEDRKKKRRKEKNENKTREDIGKVKKNLAYPRNSRQLNETLEVKRRQKK
jgi:hypothetical protein